MTKIVGWKSSVKYSKDKLDLNRFVYENGVSEMKLNEFVEKKNMFSEEYLQLISEVAGSHRLSSKIERLIEKLEDKKITMPSSDLPDLNKVIKILEDEILKKIRFLEREYEKGNINSRQVAFKLKRYKTRALQVKKFLQEKKILNKIDWQFLVYAGLGLMWLPSAITSGVDFAKMMGSKSAGG
jgi:hypothetical protein